VLYLKAELELKKRRADLAEPLFEKALGRNSRFIDLYLQMGDIESTEKKNDKLAEFYYSVALRYEPFNPKAMLGVASARFQLDSPSRAISFLKDKLNTQPNSAAIMTNLAIIYLRSGDQLSGKNYLQNAIRSDAHYAEAFRLLGNLTNALASYEMYSKLAPNDPEGYKATADLYFDIRDLGAAAKNYAKVLSLTPNYPDVRLRLAQISRNGGDGDNAMKLLDEEIKVNPKSDAAWVEKGNIFMAKKDLQPATNAFTEAAHINEKNTDALFGLGVVYHVKGSYDNALSLFERVKKLDPLKPEVYWQMGLIYQRMGNRVKAMQAFTNYKGIVHDPSLIQKADEKLRELSAGK
jgi:protein O-GlcNAc transferase